MAGQESGAGVLGAEYRLRGDVELAIVVERVNDRRDDERDEPGGGDGPHVPDHAEGAYRAQHGEHEARPGVLRHVDRDEVSHRPDMSALLHVAPGVALV